MNRLLLPAGLVLAALVAFDNVFDQRLRLIELERASVCKPEELTSLRQRLQREREVLANSIEARIASEREFAQKQSRWH